MPVKKYEHDEEIEELICDHYNINNSIETQQLLINSHIRRIEDVEDAISHAAGVVFSENIELLNETLWNLDKDGYLYCRWNGLKRTAKTLIEQVKEQVRHISFNIKNFPVKLYWSSDMVYLEVDVENKWECLPTLIRNHRFDKITMSDIDSDHDNIKDHIMMTNRWFKMRRQVHSFLKSLDIIDTLEREVPIDDDNDLGI